MPQSKGGRGAGRAVLWSEAAERERQLRKAALQSFREQRGPRSFVFAFSSPPFYPRQPVNYCRVWNCNHTKEPKSLRHTTQSARTGSGISQANCLPLTTPGLFHPIARGCGCHRRRCHRLLPPSPRGPGRAAALPCVPFPCRLLLLRCWLPKSNTPSHTAASLSSATGSGAACNRRKRRVYFHACPAPTGVHLS